MNLFFKVLIVVLIMMFNSAVSISAQNLLLSVDGGMASFNQTGYLTIQNYLASQNPAINLKATDQFPSRPFYRISLSREFNQDFHFGIFWGYSSTGGRLTASDYSAEITLDQISVYSQLGVLFWKNLSDQKRIDPFIKIQLSMDLARLELRDRVKIFNQKSEESTFLKSTNITFEPEIGIQLKFLPLSPNLFIGYLYHIHQFPLHLESSTDAKLIINDEFTYSDYSGFRAGITANFNLNRRPG